MGGIKEATANINGMEIKAAVVHGTGNASYALYREKQSIGDIL
jgi:hypothetical protein